MLPSQTQQSSGRLEASTFVSSQSVTLPWLSEPLDKIPRRGKSSTQQHLVKNQVDQEHNDLFDDSDDDDFPEYPDFTKLACDTETIPASDKAMKKDTTQGSSSKKADEPSLSDMEGPAPKDMKTANTSVGSLLAPTVTSQQFGTHGSLFEPVAKKPRLQLNETTNSNIEEPSNALPVISKPTPVHFTSLFLPLLPRMLTGITTTSGTLPTPAAQNLFQFASSPTSAFFPLSLLTQPTRVLPEVQRDSCIVRKRPAGNICE